MHFSEAAIESYRARFGLEGRPCVGVEGLPTCDVEPLVADVDEVTSALRGTRDENEIAPRMED